MVRLTIEQRRELIIEAAWRVMIKDGVCAATTRAICAEAGMPQSAFHYCFDSRAELLKLAVTDRIPEQLAFAANALRRHHSLQDALAAALRAYWRDVELNTERHAVLYDITMTSYYDPDLRELCAFQYAQYHRTAEVVLRSALDDAGYETDMPIEHLAVGLVAFLNGITLRYVVDPTTPGLEDALESYITYVQGLLRPARPVTA